MDRCTSPDCGYVAPHRWTIFCPPIPDTVPDARLYQLKRDLSVLQDEFMLQKRRTR